MASGSPRPGNLYLSNPSWAGNWTIASKRTTLGAPGTARLDLKPKRVKRGAKLTARVTVTLADGAATTLKKAVRISR